MADNIADGDRERFDQLFVECMTHMLERAIELSLPNAYMETFIARMIAMRSAACDEDISTVSVRVTAMAEDYGSQNASAYAEARELGRLMRSTHGTKH